MKQTVVTPLDPNLSNHDQIRAGVSFASAGSGYDDLTFIATGVIPVSKQLDQFMSYTAKLSRIVGATEAKNIIQNSLVVISAGSNDSGFNDYLLPFRRAQVTSICLQDLYNQGCRTIAIAGFPPMGSLPVLITARLEHSFDRTCLEDENADARSYNQKLVNLLPQLQASLPGSRIVYAGVYIHH
ncbi:hypothetical protein CRYUN_Cryun03dG0179000 [Craigia yunnanensis]